MQILQIEKRCHKWHENVDMRIEIRAKHTVLSQKRIKWLRNLGF